MLERTQQVLEHIVRVGLILLAPDTLFQFGDDISKDAEFLRDMKALVSEMDSHIHGRAEVMESNLQSEVDALF